jgi:hypothetical protein
MVASLPCGFELRREGAFNRLFGLGTLDRRRSRFATALLAPWHDRSVGGRRFAGFSLRFEACEATCWIGHDFTVFLNIQGAKTRRKQNQKAFTSRHRGFAVDLNGCANLQASLRVSVPPWLIFFSSPCR